MQRGFRNIDERRRTYAGTMSLKNAAERAMEDSRQDALLKAADDREFREQLYREYGLKEDAG